MSQETIFEYTKIDPWFLSQLGELHEAEQWLKTQNLNSLSYDDLLATKQRGFSDAQIARCLGETVLQEIAKFEDSVAICLYKLIYFVAVNTQFLVSVTLFHMIRGLYISLVAK